jgi:type II secretory pathway component GspD/PulD (secretin)
LQYGDSGKINDPETAAGTEVQSASIPPFDGTSPTDAPSNQGATETTARSDDSMFPVYVPPQKPQVIYNSDTNILWVVATRKQHKWVADYLSRVDNPQNLIAIEVKFFETNKNPQTEFGINWQGVFGGDGLRVTGQGSVGNQSSTAELGGFTIAGQPYSAVLSVQQATLAIQAFARDREGSLVQYPRVLTINNREVAITSAENTPINSGVQNVSSGSVGGQNVGSLEYLPTGTQINILPKSVGKDQIALTVAITISSIIDLVNLNLGTGVNQYPVTAERVYNASLQVDSGYTLAVGGLDKSTDLRNDGGIPLLKDIPGVGYLFKNKGRDRRRSNLIIFITPYVITDPARTPGISENPESTLPVRPGLPPPAPTFSPDGQLVGGDGAISGALAWLEYQLKYFQQINKEARDDAQTNQELRIVIQRARALSSALQARVLDGAGYAPAALLDNSARADALLVELNKTLAAAQMDQFQLNQGLP